jgi:hypothetical protein
MQDLLYDSEASDLFLHNGYGAVGHRRERARSHSADKEQCYANTIRSLDLAIGYRQHVREGNSLTQIFE